MKARILIIEDNLALRNLLASYLTSVGHDVFVAADGREGEAQLARESVDLIVTDVLMPNRDGIETIIAVRKMHPRLPIIAMTGGSHFESDYYLRFAVTLGVTRVLRKPFGLDEFHRCVNELLDIPPAS